MPGIDAGSASNVLRALEALAAAKSGRGNRLRSGLQTGAAALTESLNRQQQMDFQAEQAAAAQAARAAEADKNRAHDTEQAKQGHLYNMQRDFVNNDDATARSIATQKAIADRQAASDLAATNRGVTNRALDNVQGWSLLKGLGLSGKEMPFEQPTNAPPQAAQLAGAATGVPGVAGGLQAINAGAGMKPPSPADARGALVEQAKRAEEAKIEGVNVLLSRVFDPQVASQYRIPTNQEFLAAFEGAYGRKPDGTERNQYNEAVSAWGREIAAQVAATKARADMTTVETGEGSVAPDDPQRAAKLSADARAKAFDTYPQLRVASNKVVRLKDAITDESDARKYKEASAVIDGTTKVAVDMSTARPDGPTFEEIIARQPQYKESVRVLEMLERKYLGTGGDAGSLDDPNDWLNLDIPYFENSTSPSSSGTSGTDGITDMPGDKKNVAGREWIFTEAGEWEVVK